MAPSTPPAKAAEPRPGPLRSSRSFPRHGTQEVIDPLTRNQRANTIQNDGTPEIIVQQTSPQKHGAGSGGHDAFEADDADDSVEPPRASVDLDDIPIELVSLTDNFIDSLLAKVHPAPPNIDNLSARFQDFYHTAAPHIQTHIETLALRQKRTSAVRPPALSRPSAASLLRAKAASLATKEKAKPAPQDLEQQMLTAEELADRKRERKALDQKRALLEEAVERRLCEGMYDRIYRHRTTQDEAVDDKLRSKTAAFTMLGIGPANLGIDLSERGGKEPESAAKKQEDIRESLEQARRDLILMHEKRYPLGKLNHLKNAHKSIVETLSQFHPSASADEIMPMLIYTLITLPADKLNVASDCNFIQRFRWEEKLSGETAYCLTNLEAAINFLETVDLASLHAEEPLAAPPGRLESVPDTPGADATFPPAYNTSASSLEAPSGTTATDAPRRPPSPATAARTMAQRRRLSDLIQTPAQAIGNARDSFFDTADQGFKNISNSLGDSYNFLMGKLRDTSVTGSELVVPRTLDDARKLIGTPPIEDDASVDGIGSAPGNAADKSQSRDDKVLNLIGGRKAPRDRSADSARSAQSAGSSSKKVLFADDNKEKMPAAAASSGSASNPALVDQMRNFGNSLNPMNRLASMSMMRGFGRTTPTSTPPAKESAPGSAKSTDGGDLATAFPDIAAALPPKQDIPQIKPPNKRFMDLQNPADLKLGEVLELLRDYRRLAGALKERDAFKES